MNLKSYIYLLIRAIHVDYVPNEGCRALNQADSSSITIDGLLAVPLKLFFSIDFLFCFRNKILKYRRFQIKLVKYLFTKNKLFFHQRKEK